MRCQLVEQVIMPRSSSPAQRNTRKPKGFAVVQEEGVAETASEVVREPNTSPFLYRGKWQGGHGLDAQMHRKFVAACAAVQELIRRLHSRNNRVNNLSTFNLEQISILLNLPVAKVQKLILKQLRNLFRTSQFPFAGIWRREVLGKSCTGEHLHIAFHAPRNFREMLMRRLPVWLGDPIDLQTTSNRFDRSKWTVNSKGNTWNMKRIYNLAPLLEYLAKVPLGPDGKPLSREARLARTHRPVREFAVFGVSLSDFGK